MLLVTKELDEKILPEAVTLVDTMLAALILVVTNTLPVATTLEVVTLLVTYTLPVATTFDVVILLVTKELDENILPEAVTFVDITLEALTLPEIYAIPVDIKLPELAIGEWCFIKNFGAYTVAASTEFNGFSKTKAFYIFLN